MFINKPIVRHQKIKRVIAPQSHKNNPNPDHRQKEDPFTLINMLEHKIQEIANDLADKLTEYRKIDCDDKEQYSLEKSKAEMEMAIKKQVQKENQVKLENQKAKMKLQAYIFEYKTAVAKQKQQIQKINKFKNGAEGRLKQIQLLQKIQKQLEKELDAALEQKRKKQQNCRISTQTSFKIKEDLSNMDIDIFNLSDQNESFYKMEMDYAVNLKNIEEYSQLQKIKKKLVGQIAWIKDQYNSMSQERLEILLKLKINIEKINKVLVDLEQKLYEQRYILGIKLNKVQQQTLEQQNQSESQENDSQYQQRLKKHLKQRFLPPLPKNSWVPYRNDLDNYLENRKEEVFDRFRRRSQLFKKKIPTYSRESFDSDRRLFTEQKLEQIAQSENQMLDQKSNSDFSTQNKNIYRRYREQIESDKDITPIRKNSKKTLKLKLQKNNRNKIMDEQNTEQLKQKIKKHIRQTQERRKRLLAKDQNDSVVLISVNQSENDPDHEYVEVEVEK